MGSRVAGCVGGRYVIYGLEGVSYCLRRKGFRHTVLIRYRPVLLMHLRQGLSLQRDILQIH
jgi:hypothetical protein